MNKCRNGSGTFHGIGQPNIQRNLSRLAGCSNHHQQGRGCKHADTGFDRQRGYRLEYLVVIERAKVLDQQEHSQKECEVPDAVSDERLLASLRCRLLEEKKSDQQI